MSGLRKCSVYRVSGLKCYWDLFQHIHIFKMHENLFKIKSNDTQFEVIEDTILDLLSIHYLDWWRHWLFSIIRETFVKKTDFFQKFWSVIHILSKIILNIFNFLIVTYLGKFFVHMMLHTHEIFNCFHFLKFLLLMKNIKLLGMSRVWLGISR